MGKYPVGAPDCTRGRKSSALVAQAAWKEVDACHRHPAHHVSHAIDRSRAWVCTECMKQDLTSGCGAGSAGETFISVIACVQTPVTRLPLPYLTFQAIAVKSYFILTRFWRENRCQGGADYRARQVCQVFQPLSVFLSHNRAPTHFRL